MTDVITVSTESCNSDYTVSVQKKTCFVFIPMFLFAKMIMCKKTGLYEARSKHSYAALYNRVEAKKEAEGREGKQRGAEIKNRCR